MGRKNLLASLSEPELPAGNSAPMPLAGQGAPHLGIMGTRGAIGAVTRSIEQLKAQSVLELQPELIDASFITDRLDGNPASHADLVASIRAHGQQVPILVRPHPEIPGRFQIAYGRRRLRAVSELGQPVRAVVKPLSDQQLVVAQGQENSARTDLSFIEKALFAAKLEESGFDRETIMASLTVDKTGLSRLISTAAKVPRDLIEAIGPAPKAGRDRWLELATRLELPVALTRARAVSGAGDFAQLASDDRFTKLFEAAAAKRPKSSPAASFRKANDGTRLAKVVETPKGVTLAIETSTAGAFGRYLVEKLPELYEAFKRSADSESDG